MMLLCLNPLYGVLDPLVYITYNCSVVYIYIDVVAAIERTIKDVTGTELVFISLHLHIMLQYHINMKTTSAI